jgi:predicted Zn-dependent protease
MDATLPPLPDDLGLTLIRALASLRPARRVVALTGRPLQGARGFTSGGEAQVAGRIGVVSTGGPREPDLLAARLAHEVGHLGGLRHCGTPGCLMVPHLPRAGHGEASPTLCEGCREQLLTAPQTRAMS